MHAPRGGGARELHVQGADDGAEELAEEQAELRPRAVDALRGHVVSIIAAAVPVVDPQQPAHHHAEEDGLRSDHLRRALQAFVRQHLAVYDVVDVPRATLDGVLLGGIAADLVDQGLVGVHGGEVVAQDRVEQPILRAARLAHDELEHRVAILHAEQPKQLA